MNLASALVVLNALLVRTVTGDDIFQCAICGEGRSVGSPLDVVSIPQQDDATCAQLELASQSGGIDEQTCGLVQQYIDQEGVCGCTGNTTSAPSAAPTPPLSASPTFGPAPACFLDLNDIDAREKSLTVDETEVGRTYILCTNKEYEMGISDPDNPGGYILGFNPLAPRPNVHYQCGLDGLSSDNCVLKGGHFGALVVGSGQEDRNITFQGLTFEGHQRTAVLGARPGELTFDDCIFRNINGFAPILTFFPGSGERRRASENPSGPEAAQLQYFAEMEDALSMQGVLLNPTEDQPGDEHRGRELLILKTLTLTFDSCLFEGNTPLPSSASGSRNFIVGGSGTGTIFNFQDTIFLDNNYGDPLLQPSTTAVNTFGPVNMRNTCFVNNTFLRLAPVTTYGHPPLDLSDNYVSPVDSALACGFVANFDSPSGVESLVNFTCTEMDATHCLPIGTGAPTSAPTAGGAMLAVRAPLSVLLVLVGTMLF